MDQQEERCSLRIVRDRRFPAAYFFGKRCDDRALIVQGSSLGTSKMTSMSFVKTDPLRGPLSSGNVWVTAALLTTVSRRESVLHFPGRSVDVRRQRAGEGCASDALAAEQSSARRGRKTDSRAGGVGDPATEPLDLLAKCLARLRVDNGHRRRDREARRGADRGGRTSGGLDDLVTQANTRISDGLPRCQAAADQSHHFARGELPVIERVLGLNAGQVQHGDVLARQLAAIRLGLWVNGAQPHSASAPDEP